MNTWEMKKITNGKFFVTMQWMPVLVQRLKERYIQVVSGVWIPCVFSMVASYLFVHDLRVSKIVMLDKAIINWNHIQAVNETAAEEQRPVIESWNGCNLHQVDTVVDRLEHDIE